MRNLTKNKLNIFPFLNRFFSINLSRKPAGHQSFSAFIAHL
jgi:hypothetical protein